MVSLAAIAIFYYADIQFFIGKFEAKDAVLLPKQHSDRLILVAL